MGLLIDGLLIVLYFATIVTIGLRMGAKEESLNDFALGGRNVPWWAVMASLIAAETSAATFLGAPVEGYTNKSLAYVQLVVGLIIGRYLVGTVFLKPYYRYKVYTVYDYLGVRFGPKTKNFVSGLFLVMRTLASGTRLFVPSLVIVLAWRLFTSGGAQVEVSQNAVNSVGPYFVAIVVLTAVTCIYAALGGIKAVIWTDVIQATLMFGSALVAVATLFYHIGGFDALLAAAPKMKTLEGYFVTGLETDIVSKWKTDNKIEHAMTLWDYVKLILASNYTVFSATIGATLGNMAAFGTDQDMAQRLLTAESAQKARRSLLTAAFMDIPIAATFTFIGILLYAYYQMHPVKDLADADIFGYYILNVMPTGIRGLVLAGVFSTAMGSLSAALNALATSATNDWYIPRTPGRTEAHYVTVARLFTALFAVLMCLIAVAFAYAKIINPKIAIIPVVLGIAGFILGPMLGVFLLGMLTKNRGSDKGNVIALIAGLAATIVLGNLHITIANGIAAALHIDHVFEPLPWMPVVSFTWFAMIGAIVVFIVGVFFKTPQSALDHAERVAQEADSGNDDPLAMRQAVA